VVDADCADPDGRLRLVSRALITGGAGFIGSNLADRLHADGDEVVVYDDFSTGQRRFVGDLEASPRATVVEGDVLDPDALGEAMAGCDVVFHLAANADVRRGLEHPGRDLRQNTIATFTVLEAMRARGIRRIVFSSTGSVYGEPEVFPTPEDCPFPRQTSLYGASKLAGEALIQAYCEGYGFTGVVLRFVSIMGERYTHGHLFDFVRALREDPSRLEVLGDGRQRKSYLYVGDCVEAMTLLAGRHEDPGVRTYNLGTDEVTTVDESVARVCAHLGVGPYVVYTGGSRGWIGDSPLIHLECSRVRALGWRPRLTIAEAVERTLDWLDANSWVFGARAAA
jgi:UDP-glucose 4-epimerase